MPDRILSRWQVRFVDKSGEIVEAHSVSEYNGVLTFEWWEANTRAVAWYRKYPIRNLLSWEIVSERQNNG
jgi:hypothetical protein